MLEISNLTTGYGLVQVLDQLSLVVPKGKVVTLLGANGAGKSTALNTVAGLVKPWSGSIRLDGVETAGTAANRLVRMGQSLVAEQRELFRDMTVHDNLMLGAFTRSNRQETRQSLDFAFDMFPRLKERRNQSVRTLSGGEQQMLAIARALMAKPRLLMLDEPSLGIAPLLVKEIFERIRAINELGVSILVVEQNAFIALDVAHYGYVMERGRIVFEGEPEQLRSDPRIQEAYLGTGGT